MMEYRKLGRTGLMVSVVGCGTAPLGDMYGSSNDDAALRSAYRAVDAGINFFDSSSCSAAARSSNGGLEPARGRPAAIRRQYVVIVAP